MLTHVAKYITTQTAISCFDGDKNNPDNYRDITLLSCLGKRFTAVLNKRLNYYADYITLLSEAQTGFRKGYSTSDNIFVLSSLIEYLLSKGRKKSLLCFY